MQLFINATPDEKTTAYKSIVSMLQLNEVQDVNKMPQNTLRKMFHNWAKMNKFSFKMVGEVFYFSK